MVPASTGGFDPGRQELRNGDKGGALSAVVAASPEAASPISSSQPAVASPMRSSNNNNSNNNGSSKTTTQNGVGDDSGDAERGCLVSSNRSTSSGSKSCPGGGESEGQKASIMASVATSINNMTYLKQRAGLASNEETMASYLKSLQIKRDILGPDHLSVGKTLNNIGSVFYLKKEYEPALSAYKDARRIMEDKLGSGHCDVGTVMSNIGDVYYATHRKEDALLHYRGALDIRWKKLGSQDPKVIRLMKQVASLETGQQPEKDEDDVSQRALGRNGWSEHGDPRDSEFTASIKDLSAELEDDMRYFDLVEREMAISMVKDKMKIFREMRDLYSMDEDGDDSDGADYDDERYADEDDYFCMPGTPESRTEPMTPRTPVMLDDFDADVNIALVAGQGTLPVPNSQSIDAVDDEKDDGISKEKYIDLEQEAAKPETETPVKSESGNPILGQVERSEPHEGHGTEAADSEVAVMTGSAHTYADQDRPHSSPEPVPSRPGHQQVGLKSYRGASPAPGLSVEQRREALNTVKERLARLRAERSTRFGGDGVPRPHETPKKSYMFPTVSSAAKQVGTSHNVKSEVIEL